MNLSEYKYTGKIICLAFPDTFVKHSTEKVLKILPYLGLGTKTHIKAGHAALVLVKNQTGKAEYYDFGRYITPHGYGRVRSAQTDVELEIPFSLKFDATSQIINIEQLLVWLEQNPDKTHGSGRLVASVLHYVDYDKAKDYLLDMQNRGNVLYKAFGSEGSNCSRIVTETILRATNHPKIIKRLLRNKKFTPSTIGNVEAVALDRIIYEVNQGRITFYEGTALKENLKNYFDKDFKQLHVDDGIAECNLKDLQYLSGIGSGAYFKIEKLESISQKYKITRYNDFGKLDFQGIFATQDDFDIKKPYRFTYSSNCKHCHIIQNDTVIKFEFEKVLSLKRKEHLA